MKRIHIVNVKNLGDDFLEVISNHSFFLGRKNDDVKFQETDEFDGDLKKVTAVFVDEKNAYFVIDMQYVYKMTAERFESESWVSKILNFEGVGTGKTNIQVSREVRDYLADLGKKGESYDDILQKLILFYEIHRNKGGYNLE